ncbi:anaphase-promoting complex subunit 5 isoform X2 [Iris pallida]|uniref:Anaphase-promoting complex subunit 5 isoform X2 n=1 Tax=Iris pallida TaxID=29817 RepID=A0AAX6GZU3_IRIPA|nr:anaphase-promoting complex subunit 5 isoform X2 [Iris pallida]KAJ6833861.1 anaphase-promoting complex subunit 5 isoform X2 [Iris pallida]
MTSPTPFHFVSHLNRLGLFLFSLTRNNDVSCLAYILAAVYNLV